MAETARKYNIIPNVYKNSPYCMSVNDNIFPKEMDDRFKKMFLNGNGNELDGKACALHSSSMLAFNFFYWIDETHPFEMDGYKFTKAYFEVQLPTLQGSTPANMDVVLEGKDVLLFIESKFTEHFSNANSQMKKMLDSSYCKRNSRYKYYYHNAQNFSNWESLIKDFATLSEGSDGYYDGIKQEICHLIALTNLKHDEKVREDYEKRYEVSEETERVDHPTITGNETFLFYNVLFDPEDNYEESNCFKNYKEDLYEKLEKELEDNKLGWVKNDITMKIKSYRDIFEKIPDTADVKHYLEQRYMNFSK